NTLRYRMEKYGLDRARESGSPAPPTPVETAGDARGMVSAAVAGRVGDESRRLTFLHAVVVESEPRAARRAGRRLDVVAEKTEAFGGRVEDRGPRELTAVFGLGSIEDAPRRAAHAAMAILKAAERAQDEGDNSRVKLVIHVAQVLVARAGATTTIHAEAVSDSAAACKRLL